MTIYTLYVKTHEITGLKYLGQTTKNPETYKGSGIDWKKHLKDHGNYIITEILYQTDNRENMKELGRYYSELWNVTHSVEWANRIPETGGGCTPSYETRQKIREKLLGKKKPPRTKEHTEKIASKIRGKPNPKTSDGLKRYFAENGVSKEVSKKHSDSLKVWYTNNPDKKYYKTENICNTRTLNDCDRLRKVINMINAGLSNSEIQSQIKIDYATIRKLRNGLHRVFTLFPELKELI